MPLVTIMTSDNNIDIHMMKGKLESEEITCYVFDENIVTLNPLFNIAVGGIKLRVHELDAEKARDIIKEINSTPSRDEFQNVIKCPQCGSESLYKNFRSMKGIFGLISAIISFILSIFPIYFKSVYKCKACDFEFKE
jgi:DNA-directed RNA polymerase subunit RPC12/RpoP